MKNILIILSLIAIGTGCSINKEKKEVKPTQAELSIDLYEAIIAEDYKSTQNIISDGADLNSFDGSGYSPLMRAIQTKNALIVDLLIEKGAKIYLSSPKLDNIEAIDLIAENDEEVLRLYKAAETKLLTQVEDSILSEDPSKLDSIMANNFIDAIKVLPDSEKSIFNLLALNSSKESESLKLLETYVEEIGPDLKDQDTTDLKNQLSVLKSKKILASYFEAFAGNEEISTLTPNDEDLDDYKWLAYKISLLNNNEVPFDLFKIEENIKTSDEDFESTLAVFNVVLDSNNNDQDKSQFTKELLLRQLRSRDKVSAKNIKTIVDSWSAKISTARNYALDSFVVLAIERFKDQSLSAEDLSDAVSALAMFAPDTSNNLSESYSLMIRESYSGSEIQTALRSTMAYSDEAPNNLLSLLIKNSKTHLLNTFLDEGVKIDYTAQTSSIQTAIEGASNSELAFQNLLWISEKGVPFNNEYGVRALTTSYEEIIKDQDSVYGDIFSFLINRNDSPIKSLDKEKVASLLREFLYSSSESGQNWTRMSEVISKLDSSIFDEDNIYSKELLIDGVQYEAKISFVFDLLTSGYDSVQRGLSSTDNILMVLSSYKEKFKLPRLALSFDGSTLSIAVTQHLKVLTSLLAATPNQVENERPVNINPSDFFNQLNNNQPLNLEVRTRRTDIKNFVDGEFYKSYSLNKVFWQKAATLIFNDQTKIDLNGVEIVKALDYMSDTNLSQILPEAFAQFSNLKIILDQYERSCLFSTNTPTVRLDGSTINQPVRNFVSGKWSSLGNFRALKTLKSKSCSGKALSLTESNFVKEYVKNNFASIGALHTTLQTNSIPRSCQGIRSAFSSSYSALNRTPLGNAVKIEEGFSGGEISRFGVARSCQYIKSSVEDHKRAKTQFLNQWYSCTSSNADSAMNSFFEANSSTYSLSLSPGYEYVKICERH